MQEEFKLGTPTKASTNRIIADLSLFDSDDPLVWERAYEQTMEKKYAKGSRNFGRTIHGTPCKDPQIFLIPRVRGGPSYKKNDLQGTDPSELQYCPISKGFSMQNVSSFTLGPIIGEGLCLVNAAFSKCICIGHLEGGGKVDLKRKNFWKSSKHPIRKIKIKNNILVVDNISYYNLYKWLQNNEDLWYQEWEE